MAKVVQPLMSLEARGKMGGLIYNVWRGMCTVKAFRSPVQPNSTQQLDMRKLMTDATRAWAALTAAQRTAWNAYAVDHLESDWTGVSKRLTGQNWFVRCYVMAKLCGAAAITAAPTVSAPASLVGAGFAYVAGPPKKVTLTWTSPVAPTSFLQIWLTDALSAGRIPKMEMATESATIAASTASPYDVVNPITAGRYGFWCRVIDSATGLYSEWTSADITVP